MPGNTHALIGPWTADIDDLDPDEFRIVRGADKRPLAYVDKHLSQNAQDDLAKLLLHSPELLKATRSVFFAVSDAGVPQWSPREWERWRKQVGPVLAQLWVTT